MYTFWQDLRFGARTLLKSPGFAIVAVASLALGVGAITSVYSMVSAVLLNPAPFEEGDRLVSFMTVRPSRGEEGGSVSYPDFKDFQEQNQVLEHVAAYADRSFNLSGPEGPERVVAGRVSASFFPLLRVTMPLGRNFSSEEDQVGGNHVAILGHALWERRYSSRPDIVGQSITLHGAPFTVVGVAPTNFRFLETGNCDLWVPITTITAGAWFSPSRGSHWMRVMGRLKDGVSREQAQAEMVVIAARLAEQYPDSNADKTVRLARAFEDSTKDATTGFSILFGAVAFVLLIACVNVANLLLARAAQRQKEVAIRIALGASRARLVQQLLTENLLLAVLGGACGLLVALWGNDFIFSLLPPTEAQFYIDYFQFGMNTEVFLFTGVVVVLTAVLFGLVPALQASNPDVNEFLKEGGAAAGAGRGRHRLLAGLVVSEVALALVLLVGAGLMIRSFQRLQHVDPGFDPSHLLTASLSLPESAYPDNETQVSFFERLGEQLEAVGGVEAVGAADMVPFSDSNSNNAIHVEGYPPLPPGQYYLGETRSVTPGYFEALGAPVLSGRAFTAGDRNPDAPVTVINEAMAKKFWPDEGAVGKRFKLGTHDSDNPWMTVVGVVGNTGRGLFGSPFLVGKEYFPTFYMPLAEAPRSRLTLLLRTSAEPESMGPSLRSTVSSLDANLPLSRLETMEEMMERSVWANNMNTMLLSLFAGIALFLAAVGVYGVINYSVTQRTHEFGIRMALGAQPGDVRGLVVRQGLRLALMGVVLGLLCAVGLTRLMTSLLYGVSPTDPATFAAVAAGLIAVALLASYIPARRATKVEPMTALRYE